MRLPLVRCLDANAEALQHFHSAAIRAHANRAGFDPDWWVLYVDPFGQLARIKLSSGYAPPGVEVCRIGVEDGRLRLPGSIAMFECDDFLRFEAFSEIVMDAYLRALARTAPK